MKKNLLFLCLIMLFDHTGWAQHQASEKNSKEAEDIIDSLGLEKLLLTAQPFYYDAVSEFKGISLNTQGFLFKDIYGRGYNNSGRFLQITDGAANRLPGLNFVSGNIAGIPAIDIGEVKLARRFDGSGGMGGSLIINSKNPFIYQGLSAHYRIGMNHAGSFSQKASPWETMALRYARVLNKRFAVKSAVSYTQGEDWQSQNTSNFDRINMVMQAGSRETDPAYDGVNLYGDEPGTLTLNQIGGKIKDKYPGIPCGCIPEPDQSVVRAYNAGLLPKLAITRTGYPESEILDNYTNSFKVSGAIHYKLGQGAEASIQAAWGSGSGIYTDFDRYALKNFNIGQYKIEITSSSFLLRAYTILERSGNSYNASLLGGMINEAWKPSSSWLQQYTLAYAKERLVGTTEQSAHLAARAAADKGRPQAGSSTYYLLKEDLINTATGNSLGVKLTDRSNLFNYETAYDFSRMFSYKFDLKAGASFRQYQPESKGTFFDDADRDIKMNEYSGFVQLGKNINPKLKLAGIIRFDKSSNYKLLYSPGVNGTYSLKDKGRIWASYQLGFRNPFIQDQYLDYAMGGGNIRIAGGLPEILEKYDLYTNRAYTAESYLNYQASDGSSILNEYFFSSDGVQPEHVQSFEIGWSNKMQAGLELNASAYYSIYSDYISPVDVYQRINPAEGLGQMRRFMIPVNINEDLNAWGGTLGLAYPWKKLLIDANAAYNYADELPAAYSGGSNVPDIMFNAGISSRKLVKNFGFKAVYRWQNKFYWHSGFVNGQVPAFGTLDGQISYKLPQYNAVLKLGGSNLLNRYYMTSYGNPLIGGMYYFSILFDQLIK